MAARGENLREACCIGDYDAVRGILACNVDVNSQNSTNGWTALHWAVHRGHGRVVSLLLTHGADPKLANSKGQTPADLAKRDDVIQLLGGQTPSESDVKSSGGSANQDGSGFQPNYLKHPQLVYRPPQKEVEAPVHASPSTAAQLATAVGSSEVPPRTAAAAPESKVISTTSTLAPSMNDSSTCSSSSSSDLVVKVRVVDSGEDDFVEVDVATRTFSGLVQACAEELEFDATSVAKVRRLPNVLVRKDRDVERLVSECELEVVLKT
ncbi:ankyrin repeat domain-containing protein 40-like [Sycon ciliatum]|uniref:ankyrin repeat domain-containing protein 40-like n=1 Tax=Sycon ciliatum TaxID=27933 RepID=UPI0020A8CBEA|eukprot:scpid85946/ scgid6992/ Ankyrin repeat domain-containing protein 40